MFRQIKLLLGIQFCNLCGVNQVRYTKDKKQKRRFIGMTAIWIFLGMMLIGYVVVFSYGMVYLGMAEMIPTYLAVVTSLIIFFFGMLKAGGMIFQMNSYEILVSLPVSGTAIVISRFINMYITNLLLSALVMVPGFTVYGILVKAGFIFVWYSLLGIMVLPLLPMTAATAVGAFITAVSAKMKHKSIVSSMFTVLFAIILIGASNLLSSKSGEFDKAMLSNIAEVMKERISGIYPPADWFGQAVVEADLVKLLLLMLVSFLCFGVMMAVLQKKFLSICMALHTTSAKNDYQMKSLTASTPLKALWKRELRRYFASSIYISNTIIGYVLMAAASITVFIMGVEKMETLLNFPGMVGRIFPFLIAMMAVIMPTTSCSISMEGKQYWLVQSLPVSSRDLWNSKILVNLTIALPFYVLTMIFGLLAVRPGFWEALCILIVPAAYILFSSVLGITVNLAMPIFDWENEIRVVKQSASAMLTMLLGILALPIPMIFLMIRKNLPMEAVCLPTVVVLLGITAVLYYKNSKKSVMLS